jgi:hypothetical protein
MRRGSLLAAAGTALILGGLASTLFAARGDSASADAAGGVSPAPPVAISQADADRGAALVAGEDRRLVEVRTISTLARWQNRAQKAPYRLSTPEGYTLVLTPRANAYRLTDLLRLEPQTLVRLSDGSYLLSEHIVVSAGAELLLSAPTGLTLRLASSADGFVSIVSMGGRLSIIGTAAKPVVITSWDAAKAAPDTTTADGRAYLRAVGGQLQVSYARLSSLGFWSGRTGGLALTGTNRPNTGSLDSSNPPTTNTPQLPGTGGDTQVLPTGPLPGDSATGSTTGDLSGLSYVSGRIDNTTVRGNAFGLFVSGADGVIVDSSSFTGSQITGIDLHRFVRSAVIQRTSSNSSGGNGISLGRATQGVQLTQVTANGNANDGLVLGGQALADGPSAVGSSTQTYGNNSVVNSQAIGNGHYGVHVEDGFNITVSATTVSGAKMGVVVDQAAQNVNVVGNHIDKVSSHGIALLDGVTKASVTGNIVSGSRIYLRDSQATVQGNTVLAAEGHGISVVGSAAGTRVANNVVDGSGSSAIDTARSSGRIAAAANATGGWKDTTGLLTRFKIAITRPMTLVWALVLAFVVMSLVRGRFRHQIAPGTHPYAHQMAHLGGP